MKFKSNLFLTITIIFAFVLTSCGSSNNNSMIATAVALTVQAHDTQSASATDTPLPLAAGIPLAASLPSATGLPLAGTPATVTTVVPPTAALPIGTVTKFCTAAATFVSETVPDGTIESPGALFTKTWNIENSGTCTWDSTWKLVFVSGDVMGAAYVFNFPQPVAPGQTEAVPIVFTAPSAGGTYRGYWKIQSPWGMEFGDSDSGNPFWVDINVNSGTPGANTPTVYGITSVDYNVTWTGCCTCGANMFYTTTATISTSGPLTITYYWGVSDGGRSSAGVQTLNFTEAGTKTVSDTWPVRLGTEIGIRWEYIGVTSPINQTFPNTNGRFDHECI